MTILAIDPGNIQSGYCVIGSDLRPVEGWFGKRLNSGVLEAVKEYIIKGGKEIAI